MKKYLMVFIGIIFAVIMTGCSGDNEPKPAAEPKTVEKDTPVTPAATSNIDTSVFSYAESVDVTDSRDTAKHIDVVVHMSDELTPELATQHVFKQAYDFLQQADIKGAETVTIGVMNGDFRVAQITVDTAKFKAGENYFQSVMKASKIDKMNPEVKTYGKETGNW